jgi:beta-glucosidase
MRDTTFFVGGGTSALGIDGAFRRSDWFRWEERRQLDASADGSGLDDLLEVDLALLRHQGLEHLRVTIDWARLEPRAGVIDDAEVERLMHRFTRLGEIGVTTWVTLHHTMLPGWFVDDTDGLLRVDGPSIHWSRHVDRVAEMFDGLIGGWIPTEDPLGWAMRSHHLGTRPGRPGEQAFRDACEGSLEATFEAARLLGSGDAPVVSSFGIPDVRCGHETAADHHTMWTDVLWTSWTEAIRDGVLRWPWRGPRERPDLADTFDAIGLALAPTITVGPDGELTLGDAPREEHFGEILRRAAALLPGRDLIVTGLGLASDDDRERDDALAGWLDQINAARNDGITIPGAFLEPLIDAYDPESGFSIANGVVGRDREPRPSSRWLHVEQAP